MYGVWSIRAATVVASAALLISPVQGQRSQEITRNMDNRPTLGPVKVEAGGLPSFQGSSAPGALVQVNVEGRLVGSTIADAVGAWRLTLPVPLEAGSHTVQVVARSQQDGVQRQGELLRINIPSSGLTRLNSSEEMAVERAGTFADEATRVFDQLMPVLDRNSGAVQVAQATGRQGEIKPAAKPAAEKDLSEWAGDWFDRAARQYSDVIVRRLAGEPVPLPTAPRTVVAEAPPTVAPRRAQVTGGAEPDMFQSAIDGIRRWFDRANSDYQRVIVRQLSDPAPGGSAVVRTTPPAGGGDAAQAPKPAVPPAAAPAVRAPEKPATPPAIVAQKGGEPEGLEWVQDRIGRWFGRANKDYQDVIVKQLSEPTAKAGEVAQVPPRAPERVAAPAAPLPVPPAPPVAKADDSVARAAEAARLAEQERQRVAAELRAEEERRRVAAETVQRAEAQRKAEEQDRLRLAEEARRSEQGRAEAARLAEQERQRIAQADAVARAEAQRREEQERQRAAEEARRVAQAEAAKAAAARRAEEEERRRTAAAQRAAEEVERRRVAEAQRVAAAERAAADAARRAEEQRARRLAAAPAEPTRSQPKRTVEKATTSRAAAAPSRRVASSQRRAYAKTAARTRTIRRPVQAQARVQRARSGPGVVRAARPSMKAKARARDRRYCLPRRVAMVTVPTEVVVVEVRGGVYHSVFERDYERRRIVMPSYAQVTAVDRYVCSNVATR